MQLRKNFNTCSIALLFLAGLCSCSSLSTSRLKTDNGSIGKNITLIEQIKPATDMPNILYIRGKVERQVPLVNQWAYQIHDSTGKIWVITHQPHFQAGQEVLIRGKVNYKSIPLADQEFGEVYLEES
ncbi:hypothetical protein [Anabaenopsis elenkinii]|uniref:Uncharacterized protein n=1 Tax=Anabaenopsis elenkinii CCIBt3563 TaxID=2779889 RepID=A0A7U3RYZ9_9CYAN|nr:hypothetical protein [Anabaenopsis elenkinii]QOV21619.1 hypothetical protein IM676_12835 [Anabaenopsis elenkinii CCIBt3563]